MNYPDHFPDDCPPPSSKFAFGKFYRYIDKKHEKPLQKDFLSYRQSSPDKKPPDGVSECQYCGLSIYSSLTDAKNLSKKIPAFRKRKKLAVGTLSQEFGKIKPTPSNNTGESHHTLWLYEDSKPWEAFHIVDESDKDSNK